MNGIPKMRLENSIVMLAVEFVVPEVLMDPDPLWSETAMRRALAGRQSSEAATRLQPAFAPNVVGRP